MGVSVGAYQRWVKRLRSGLLNEIPEKSSTWVLDDLWRAACRELTETEYRADMKWPDRPPRDVIQEGLARINKEMRGIP